jgi:hypothetical protein
MTTAFTGSLRRDVFDRFGQPVPDDHERVDHAAVLQLGKHVQPVPGTLACFTG